jgi:hypothetical protein
MLATLQSYSRARIHTEFTQSRLEHEGANRTPIEGSRTGAAVPYTYPSDSSCLLNDSRKWKCKTHHRFDPTLIALVGVLDEIKEQTNVAGWIRADSLWSGHEPPRVDGELEKCTDMKVF